MRRLLLAAAFLGLATTASASPTGPAPIIGGETTSVGQYPPVVALLVGAGLCTGTLVHPEWVLTAAHCLTPAIVGLPSQQAVTDNIRIHFKTVNIQQNQGTVRRATMTIPKPAFSVNALGSDDIGLVKLAEPVTDIEPAPVNLDVAMAPIGTSVIQVGYGATEQMAMGMFGVQFALQGRVSTSCSQFGAEDANLLCFSQTDNKGKCQGDSGGPSFAMINGKLTVVGVTSFGDEDCAIFGADTRTDIEREFLMTNAPIRGCETDAECADGDVCFRQRCIAAPFGPGGLGAECTVGTECDSGKCAAGPGGMRCSEVCTAGEANACPDGLECLGEQGASGACWPEGEGGGCCDSSGRGAPTMLFGMAIVALSARRRAKRGGPSKRPEPGR